MANPRFWTESKIISYVAEKLSSATSVAWSAIIGKPSTFPPAAHNHTKSQITDFPAIPTKTSDLTNDSGYLTSHQSLADYAKTADVVAKENGKGLSTNDYTTAEKQKLAGIAAGATKVEVVSPDSSDVFSDDGRAASAWGTKTELANKVHGYTYEICTVHYRNEISNFEFEIYAVIDYTFDLTGDVFIGYAKTGVGNQPVEAIFNGKVERPSYLEHISIEYVYKITVKISGPDHVDCEVYFAIGKSEYEVCIGNKSVDYKYYGSGSKLFNTVAPKAASLTNTAITSLFSSDGFKNATKDAIVQGEGVTITQNADKTITISATGGGGGSSKPSINTFEQLKAYIDAKIADTSFADDAARIAKMKSDLIGIEIPDTWANSGGTIYNDPMIIVNVGKWKGEDNAMHIGAMVMHKYATAESVVFDMANQEVASETRAQEGVYYYGLALGETSVTAAKLTLLELNVGDSLPKSDYKTIYKNSVRDTSRNILQYGHNNWRDSAYRQWLNSFVAKGTSWWTQKHVGQIIPSNAKTIRGYMQGCSGWSGINTDGTAKAYINGLLKFAKPVYITTSPNYVSDGGNSSDPSVGAYETLDLFFLPSGSEMFGNVNTTGTGDAMVSYEGEFSPYWKEATGFASPRTTYSAARSIFAENGQSAASLVRLRSANRGYSYIVWNVSASGNLNDSYAYNAYAASPACVIY